MVRVFGFRFSFGFTLPPSVFVRGTGTGTAAAGAIARAAIMSRTRLAWIAIAASWAVCISFSVSEFGVARLRRISNPASMSLHLSSMSRLNHSNS